MPAIVRPLRTVTVAIAVAVSASVTVGLAAHAAVIPGTDGKDVHFGLDNDNADNPFIQPPGVDVPQHMEDADVVFGRDGDDFLAGMIGDDTVVGGNGDDIVVGGPEAGTTPANDVLLGDTGNDVMVWSPGDGNDAYVGDVGTDAAVFGPFVTDGDGLVLVKWKGRQVPQVTIDDQDALRCDLVPIPPEEEMGAQFLVRFYVDDDLAATTRLKDVEAVYCPSTAPGKVMVADLTDDAPAFQATKLKKVKGLVGAIL